jgi:hydroxyacylglutathione hydrolase
MNWTALPAFSDNYIWMLDVQGLALVVDPGDAEVVLAALAERQLTLQAILLTHHHADHTGGVAALRQVTGCTVYGPAFEVLPEPVQRLSGGQCVTALGAEFEVIDVPGHTAGHIAYYCKSLPANGSAAGVLFCGDTLFSGGCGRLFEGTPAQMLASLDALAALPSDTRVFCTHEYTLSNLRFARAVEPDNTDLQAYEAHCQALRARLANTLPSSIGQELKINPFLRSRSPAVRQSVLQIKPQASSEVEYFAALREWKNTFQ